jgi:autotransporter-associated beta strand protein
LFQSDASAIGIFCNVALNAPLVFASNVGVSSLLGVVSGSNSTYGITFTGPGDHTLSGANTYVGSTIIAQGTLIATDGVGLPTASNLVLAGGILHGPSGATFTRGLGTGPGLVQWTGSGGFGCWSGTYTVNLGGHATPDTVVWGQSGFVPDGSALMLSGADFRNPIDLAGGSRTIFANSNNSTLSGAVSNGSLVKTGTGTLTFNAPSASTTLIDVTAGTLQLNSNCNISGTVRVGPAGTLTVVSPNASVGTLLLQGGTVSNSGNVLSASTTFDLQKGDCSAKLSGTGSLVKTTPDRVSLSGTNTYSGDTVLAEGRLYVGSAALSPNSNLVLTGGSLETSSPLTRSLGPAPGQVRWAGNASLVASSSSTFKVNLGSQTPATPLSWGQPYFIADGDPLMLNSTNAFGTVEFQNPIDLGSVNRTVQVVDGPSTSITDIAILSGALTEAGGLVKTGNGTLSLTAANGYGGPTIISDGAVRAIDGTGLPAGSNVVLAGGALEGKGATSFVRGLGTGPGQVQWTGSGGFSAGGGKMSVNIGGQATAARSMSGSAARISPAHW